jgi:hypothetical protein
MIHRITRRVSLTSSAVLLSFCLVVLGSCARPNRVSRRTLQRLTKQHEPFVLVFGSVSTSKNRAMHPVIRFVRQVNRTAPVAVLWSLAVTTGDRFYAILQKPPEISYLDEFDIEVGATDAGFDRILFVRLHPGDAPLAMYVGEIKISPAENRTAQGQKIAVSIDDRFYDAERELKRLYPHFAGKVTKAALLRSPVPAATPARVK